MIKYKFCLVAVLLALLGAVSLQGSHCSDGEKGRPAVGCQGREIDHVPFVIDRPGKYFVSRDLVYNGKNSAIKVKADQVSIYFCNHSLTLNDSRAVGIEAAYVSELVIEDDVIRTPTISTHHSSAAIKLFHVNKATLSNLFTENTYNGVFIKGCTDIFITHSRFKDHVGAIYPAFGYAVNAEHSSGVVVEESTFTGISSDPINSGAGMILFNHECLNGRVSNCQFSNCDTTIYLRSIDGALVENCTMNSDPTAFLGLMQTGTDTLMANNILIKDCTLSSLNSGAQIGLAIANGKNIRVENCSFSSNSEAYEAFSIDHPDGVCIKNVRMDVTASEYACLGIGGAGNPLPTGIVIENCIINCLGVAPAFDVIALSGGIGILIDNVVVNTDTAEGSGYIPAALHIGNADSFGDPSLIVSGLTARNSIFNNEACIAIRSESGCSDIVIDNCKVNGGQIAGIFFDDTVNSTIKNCEVSGGTGDGIVLNNLSTGSNDNSLLNNIVTDSACFGIKVVSGSYRNHLYENQVFSNGGVGIGVFEPITETYFNTSCNNGGPNCLGVFPAQNAGDAPLTGSNICCQPPVPQ